MFRPSLTASRMLPAALAAALLALVPAAALAQPPSGFVPVTDAMLQNPPPPATG